MISVGNENCIGIPRESSNNAALAHCLFSQCGRKGLKLLVSEASSNLASASSLWCFPTKIIENHSFIHDASDMYSKHHFPIHIAPKFYTRTVLCVRCKRLAVGVLAKTGRAFAGIFTEIKYAFGKQ
jgi:hypothetical protein